MPETGRAISNHTMYVFAKEKYLKELLRSGRIMQEQFRKMERFLYERFRIAEIDDDFDIPLVSPTQPQAVAAQDSEPVQREITSDNELTTAASASPSAVTEAHIETEYVSLTQLAREHNPDNPSYVIQLWLQNQNTVEFLKLWEQANNPHFNLSACEDIQNRLRDNTFTLTAKYWMEQTSGIGLQSKPGRYSGGTFAHPVIACEFLTGLSPLFKLSLIEMRKFTAEEGESCV